MAASCVPLAMLIPDGFDVEGLGTIPSSFTAYPGLSKYLPISQAIGFAMPADAPAEAKGVLVETPSTRPWPRTKVKSWGQGELLPAVGQDRCRLQGRVRCKLESNFAWTLWELGAAKVDPATLGIPKP